ncbi:hypothetical protein V6R85_24130 [Agrobacterium sp. CCNWLW32]|uniref:hypothetical protein n=1 Tax=Agrobacterium sp. CCNWLW32 TaxID=3122072 RepID=UPI00300FC2D3
MLAERLEIIFETAERFPGLIAFDVSIRNARYIDHRDDKQSPERLKLASDIEATAIREGYRWVPGVDQSIRRFISAFPYAAVDPRPIVDAFRDQGYDVVCRSGYMNGQILSWDELCGMSRQDHDRATREEAAYAAGRAADRAGRDAASILRLKAAALAEEAPVTAQFGSQADRNAFREYQARIREQENGIEMPEEEQRAVFAA